MKPTRKWYLKRKFSLAGQQQGADELFGQGGVPLHPEANIVLCVFFSRILKTDALFPIHMRTLIIETGKASRQQLKPLPNVIFSRKFRRQDSLSR